MKFYKTDDGWYFENEQDAINHVSIYNRAVQSEVEEELKKSKDDGIDRTEIIRIINSPCYDDFYYSGVRVHLSNIDTFEIRVSNFLDDERSKDIIAALPKGAGWQEDNWYTRKDIPQLLRVIKILRKNADIAFYKARMKYEEAEKLQDNHKITKDSLYDLKVLLDNTSETRFDVKGIRDFLREKGIDVD